MVGIDDSNSLTVVGGAVVTREKRGENSDKWNWEAILCSDPEMLIRQASRYEKHVVSCRDFA